RPSSSRSKSRSTRRPKRSRPRPARAATATTTTAASRPSPSLLLRAARRLMHELLDLFRSLTKNLDQFTLAHGDVTYRILMGIVVVESGLVIMPFLPGDSLLFAAGAVASRGILNPALLALGLVAAAVVGDTLNYHVGKAIGPRVMKSESSRLFNK